VSDDLLTVAQVRQLLGGRYARVCGGGACCPLDVNGRTMYFRPFVEQGLRKDLARYPEGRRPAAVAKAYRGGVPEVVTDRDGMRRVVVRKAAPAPAGVLTPRVRAALEEFLEKAERFLSREGIRPW
jgi:hypothetical protein